MMIRAGILMLLAAVGPSSLLRAAEEPGTTLLALSISEGNEETGVQVLIDGNQDAYTCSRRSIDGQPGIALAFPLAVSRLESFYRGSGRHLQSIEVVAGPEGEPGPVEILMRLNGDCFWSLQRSSGRLRLALRRPDPGLVSPMALSYRVGTGDRLSISVYGHEDLKQVVEVRADGTITFPLIGGLRVGDLTIEEIAASLQEELAKDFLVDPQVSVDVESYKSQAVTVAGEIDQPGRYFLRGPTTLIEVLSEAGGLSDTAGSEIVISRKSGSGNPHGGLKRITVQRESLFTRMGAEDNLFLQAGDIINVLPMQFFYIRGEVNRPGSYPLKPGTTLLKAISVAGGLKDFANRKEVVLLREMDGKQERLVLSLRAIESRKKEDIRLRPDDIIHVPRKFL